MKKKKSRQALQQLPQAHISKSNPIYFGALFLRYLNPQVRICKMANMHSVNYHVIPSGLTLWIHPFILLQCFLLSFSRNFVEYCVKDFWEDFQICGVSITGKCAFQVKKLKEYISTHVPQGKVFPKVLINTPQAEGN